MMVIAIGLSSYNIALFHLVNHAFYKALLFLGAGAVIHAVADNQDFRKYGALVKFLPLTYTVILIASLSLIAFPFMTGFYSKDFILESAYGQFSFSSTVIYYIATIAAVFTSLYSVKVLYLTFLTNPNGPLVNYIKPQLNLVKLIDKFNMPFVTNKQARENDMFICLPLIILAIFSIFFGFLFKDLFIGLASGFFSDNSIFIHPSHEINLNTDFAVPILFKNLPLIFTIFFSAISILLSEFLPKLLVKFKFSNFGYNMYSFFNLRFLIELLYNKFITGLILSLASQTTKVLDKGSVELIGPFGLEKALLTISNNISKLDTGIITTYALYILIGLLFYILVPYLSLADNSLLLLILFALFNMFNVIKANEKILILLSTSSPLKAYPYVKVVQENNLIKTRLKNILKEIFTCKFFYKLLLCFFIALGIRFTFKSFDIVFKTESDILFTLSSTFVLAISSFISDICDYFDIPNPIRYLESRSDNKNYHCLGSDGINEKKQTKKENVSFMKGNNNVGEGAGGEAGAGPSSGPEGVGEAGTSSGAGEREGADRCSGPLPSALEAWTIDRADAGASSGATSGDSKGSIHLPPQIKFSPLSEGEQNPSEPEPHQKEKIKKDLENEYNGKTTQQLQDEIKRISSKIREQNDEIERTDRIKAIHFWENILGTESKRGYLRSADDQIYREKANNRHRAYKKGEILQLQQQFLDDELKKRNPNFIYDKVPMTRYNKISYEPCNKEKKD